MTIIIVSIVSAKDMPVSPWINKKERIRSIYKYLFQPRDVEKRGRSKGIEISILYDDMWTNADDHESNRPIIYKFNRIVIVDSVSSRL